MNLTEELENFKKGFNQNAPEEVKSEMKKAYEELLAKEVGENSLRLGDKFPSFKLTNQNNSIVSLDDLLSSNNFLVISFYRGGWCPYCNLELRALQKKLSEFQKMGAGLVSITPEVPDESLSTSQKNELEFEVLSDLDSKLSKEIGISFELPENLKPIYKEFGIDVQKHNGENNFTLPVPATYLINKNKEIIYSFKDTDYTVRLDPDEILNKLKS